MGFQVRFRAIQWYRIEILQSIPQPEVLQDYFKSPVPSAAPQLVLCFLLFFHSAPYNFVSPLIITSSQNDSWPLLWIFVPVTHYSLTYLTDMGTSLRQERMDQESFSTALHHSSARNAFPSQKQGCKVFKEFYCLSLRTTDRKGTWFLLSPRRLGFVGKILYSK